MLGAAWQAAPARTLRAEVNLAAKPVPDTYMHSLFSAIMRNHLTAGVGHAFGRDQMLAFGFAHAPAVTRTTASAVTVTRRQSNFQVVLSHRY